jgi:serine/threonine-protein kinase
VILVLVLSVGLGLMVMATPRVTLTSMPRRTRDADSMVMVYVPAGAFLMGSDRAIDPDAYADELPQHSVTLDAFWIDRTEVTNAQYRKCVRAGACQPPPYAHDPNFNGDNQPVVSVSWYDAKAYCQWAGADLPTEAQWEKAARGTDGRIYPWGDQAATCEYAVMGENLTNGCGKGNAAWPVGSKPKGASPYGALDMSGNVLEWVEDWYAGYPGTTYQSDWFGTRVKVVRGGCWSVGRPHARAAARSGRSPDARGYLGSTVGFRCAAAVERGQWEWW